MNNEKILTEAHSYITKKGCKSIGQQYSAHEVQMMLVEFFILTNNKTIDK